MLLQLLYKIATVLIEINGTKPFKVFQHSVYLFENRLMPLPIMEIFKRNKTFNNNQFSYTEY